MKWQIILFIAVLVALLVGGFFVARQDLIDINGQGVNGKNSLATLSAGKIDSFQILNGTSKNYSAKDDRVIIQDSIGNLIDLKLSSPSVYETNSGTDTLISWVTLKDFTSTNLFEDVTLYDLNTNQTIKRNIKYKYGEDYLGQTCWISSEQDQFGNDVQVCTDVVLTNWTEFTSLKELPFKNIKVGLFMDTFVGDHIEWIPSVKLSDTTIQITEWAELVVPVNVTTYLGGTDQGDFIGTNISRTYYDSNKKIVYMSGGTSFGFYNFSDNTSRFLGLTDVSNWLSATAFNSMGFDSNKNVVFIAGGTGMFGFYNISSNLTLPLNATDEVNFMGTNGTRSLGFDSNKNVMIVGGNAGSFGFYNFSDNTTKSLVATDVSNWIGASQIITLTYDTNKNVMMLGATGGGFGFYNFSDNTTKPLNATDESDFINTNATNAVAFDSTNNITFIGGNAGAFGFYNFSDNTTKYLGSTDVNNWWGATAVNSLTFDSTDNIVFIGGAGGAFGFYNISSNTTIPLNATDESDFMGTNGTSIMAFDSPNNLMFVGTASGGFGVYSLGGYSIAPTFSNIMVNTTTPAILDTVLFSVLWNDNVALNTTIFSINDSGAGCDTFANTTNVGVTSSTNWTNFSHQIPATCLLANEPKIAWMVYTNDTSNNLNVSTTNFPFVVSANCWTNTSTYLYVPSGCTYYIPNGQTGYFP